MFKSYWNRASFYNLVCPLAKIFGARTYFCILKFRIYLQELLFEQQKREKQTYYFKVKNMFLPR